MKQNAGVDAKELPKGLTPPSIPNECRLTNGPTNIVQIFQTKWWLLSGCYFEDSGISLSHSLCLSKMEPMFVDVS